MYVHFIWVYIDTVTPITSDIKYDTLARNHSNIISWHFIFDWLANLLPFQNEAKFRVSQVIEKKTHFYRRIALSSMSYTVDESMLCMCVRCDWKMLWWVSGVTWGEKEKKERERAIDREKCKLMWHKNRNHEKQIFCEISGRSDIHFTRHVHVVNWIRFVLFLPHFSSFRSCIQSKYQRTNRLPYKSNIITRKYRFISPFTRFKTNQMKIEINAYTQRQ